MVKSSTKQGRKSSPGKQISPGGFAAQTNREPNSYETGLLDSLLEGCQILNPDWEYLYVNEVVVAQAHKSRQELLGHRMMDVYPGIDQTEMFAALERVMSGRQPEHFQNEFQYPDGSSGWFELHVQPHPEGILVLSQDITESKLALENSQKQLRRLGTLRQIDLAITSSVELSVVAEILLDHVTSNLEVDAAAILLFDRYSLTLGDQRSRGFLVNSHNGGALKMGEGIAGRCALEGKTIVVPDLQNEPGFIRRELAEREGFVSYFVTPLASKGQVLGVLELFHRSRLSPDHEWLDFFEIVAGQAAIAIDYIRTFGNLERANLELMLAYDRTIAGWAKTLELRDIETKGHSQRVTEMTARLAATLNYPEPDLVHIRRGAMLHDIGKMGIPDAVLFKPGALNEREWEIMKEHPTIAFNLLSSIDFLKPALDIPRYHHEKWDGSGYPRGLEKDLIPEPARIFAVVDVWDALLSDRPYRPKWSRDEALAYIKDQSGLHFDPRVVDHFVKHVL